MLLAGNFVGKLVEIHDFVKLCHDNQLFYKDQLFHHHLHSKKKLCQHENIFDFHCEFNFERICNLNSYLLNIV